MKKYLPAIILSLLLNMIFIIPANLNAGNETKWTAPVQITLDESVLQTKPSKIRLRIQVEKPAGSKYFTIIPAEGNEFIELAGTSRSGGMKDGKVDVDIIIRYEDMVTKTRGGLADMPAAVSIVAFKIEFITVDNISGVVVSNEIPDIDMGGARITGISFDDGQESPAPVETAIRFGKVSLAGSEVSENGSSNNPHTTLNTLRLFPVPVRDGVLNIEIPSEMSLKSLTIHNALGATVRKLNTGNLPGLISIPVHELESGIYFLRVQTADSNQEIVKRFFIRN
jgi:hypothetical protein